MSEPTALWQAILDQRADEKREKCRNCGTSDAACTRRIMKGKTACCQECYGTDTHPPAPTPDPDPITAAVDAAVEKAAAAIEAVWSEECGVTNRGAGGCDRCNAYSDALAVVRSFINGDGDGA